MVDEYRGRLPILGQLPSNWQIVEFGSVLEGGTRNGIYKPKQFQMPSRILCKGTVVKELL